MLVSQATIAVISHMMHTVLQKISLCISVLTDNYYFSVLSCIDADNRRDKKKLRVNALSLPVERLRNNAEAIMIPLTYRIAFRNPEKFALK